jgi:hypothetical protein
MEELKMEILEKEALLGRRTKRKWRRFGEIWKE